MFHDHGQTELVMATTPFFRLLGLIAFAFSLWFVVPTLISPDKPLLVDGMIELLRPAHPTVALCAPSILEDVSYSDKSLASLKEFKPFYLGGAPLVI